MVDSEPRLVAVAAPEVSYTDSFHLEVEAPEGHWISERRSYHYQTGGDTLTERQAGTFRRAHFHFSQPAPGAKAIVSVKLLPRLSTIIRGATFTSVLALIATLVVAIRFPEIEDSEGEIATTVLLAFTGLVGTFVIRSGEDLMASSLLLPLRILAMLPVFLTFLAAIAVLAQPGSLAGTGVLFLLSAGIAQCAYLLVRNWRGVKAAVSE